MAKIPCFKAYDIRGRVPSELNEDLAYRIGRAYASYLGAKKVVIGQDVRESSGALSKALSKGLMDAGVEVIDIGLSGTEMIYFATPHFNADGGIMITASHNPREFNGLKFVKRSSVPMGYDTGLRNIETMIAEGRIGELKDGGSYRSVGIMDDFIAHLSKFYDPARIKPLRVVVNAGNGCAGLALDRLEKILPIEMIKINNVPDSSFPNGIPNPLLPENRAQTSDAIKKTKADLGVAWDGDYDRCFFFDEKCNFIEGYYIVGLLAKSILGKHPSEAIVHDPRLVWNTAEIVKNAGGRAVQSKSGHAFIKQKMREVNGIYGGEMSAHHYFRDNAYSDSGMIPFLLMLELISTEGKSMGSLVEDMVEKYPCSGEINTTLKDPQGKLEEIKETYNEGEIDYTDGCSVDLGAWRFNVRLSNTEPLIRLNVETRGNRELLKEKTDELLNLIRN